MRRLLVIVVTFGLVLGGCGGGEEEQTQTGTGQRTGTAPRTGTATGAGTEAPAPVSLPGRVNNHGTQELADGTVQMEADDFYFAPTFVKGQPGVKATAEVHNEGQAQHTFTIDEQGIDVLLDPGQSTTAEVTLPRSGTLVFYCRFHRDQGMQGAFYVE